MCELYGLPVGTVAVASVAVGEVKFVGTVVVGFVVVGEVISDVVGVTSSENMTLKSNLDKSFPFLLVLKLFAYIVINHLLSLKLSLKPLKLLHWNLLELLLMGLKLSRLFVALLLVLL